MTSSVATTKYHHSQNHKRQDTVAQTTRRIASCKNSGVSSSPPMNKTMSPRKLGGIIPILAYSNTNIILDTSHPPTIHIQILQSTQQQLHFCVQVGELVHARHQREKSNSITNNNDGCCTTTTVNSLGVIQTNIHTPVMLNEKPVSQNDIVNNTTLLLKTTLAKNRPLNPNSNLKTSHCNAQRQVRNAACQSCLRLGSYIFKDTHSGDYVCSKCGVCSDRVLLEQDAETENLNHDPEKVYTEQDQDSVLDRDRRCGSTYGVIGERRKVDSKVSSDSFPHQTPWKSASQQQLQMRQQLQHQSQQSHVGDYFNHVGLPKTVADMWAPSPQDSKSTNERTPSRLNKRNHTQTTTTAASAALHCYDRVAMTVEFSTPLHVHDATVDNVVVGTHGSSDAGDGPTVESRSETLVPDVDHTTIGCIAMDVDQDHDPYAPTWQKGVNGWFWSVGPGAPLNIHE